MKPRLMLLFCFIRLISQQKQLLEKLRLFQLIRLESLKQKKSVLHVLEGQLENKLKVANGGFFTMWRAMMEEYNKVLLH